MNQILEILSRGSPDDTRQISCELECEKVDFIKIAEYNIIYTHHLGHHHGDI